MARRLRPKHLLGAVLLLVLMIIPFLLLIQLSETDIKSDLELLFKHQPPGSPEQRRNSIELDLLAKLHIANLYPRIPQRSADNVTEKADLQLDKINAAPTRREEVVRLANVTDGSLNYHLHAFYYPWYGNPEHDGKYIHWNHQYLPHWNKKEAKKWPTSYHEPPDDIGSNFYPELGAYSSRDPLVIHNHMQQLTTAGVGVIVVSWYPPNKADDNGVPFDSLMPQILDIAHQYKIKVAFHSEPYKSRNEEGLKSDIKYIVERYGPHPALYRVEWKGRRLPLVYVYDSYLTQAQNWSRLLSRRGDLSVRGTPYDAVFVGLLVEARHKVDIVDAHFDGFYTYFATDQFTFGSSYKNWPSLSRLAQRSRMLFIPSVGPGYVDTQVRPWNARNSRNRSAGKYYNKAFQKALAISPYMVSITSFNEWHEGTQIERAVTKLNGKNNVNYLDYGPQDSGYYLELTRQWSQKLAPKNAPFDFNPKL